MKDMPFIVGIGGTALPRSSTEQALALAMRAADRLGANTRTFGREKLCQLPHYLSSGSGIVPAAAELVSAVREADGIIIATPGYHGSISGLIKNAIDYLEDTAKDERPYFDGRPVGLIVTAYGWQATGSTLSAMRSIVHALRGWPTRWVSRSIPAPASSLTKTAEMKRSSDKSRSWPNRSATSRARSTLPEAQTSRMDGKTVVVTGATGGLGEAISLVLAAAGARVLAVARNEAALSNLADRHPLIEPWAADVTEAAFYERLSKTPLDVLVNNAGGNTPLEMVDVGVDVLDAMLNLNVRAAYLSAQAAVRSMVAADKGGAIINITSQMGHVGAAKRTVYCMTKHALEGLTKAMAVELGPRGIRVTSVAPTFVETPMTKPMLANQAFRDAVLGSIPLGRLAQPNDVAEAVLFLASPRHE